MLIIMLNPIDIKTFTLSKKAKASLLSRLQPIVASGSLPIHEDPYSFPTIYAQTQAVVGNILKQELPQNILDKFAAVQSGEYQAVLLKNFPTLGWMLPPTPEKHGEDFLGGYSNLILRGLCDMQGSQASNIDNIVAQKRYGEEKLTNAKNLKKHRDTGSNYTNALFCLRGLDVNTNLYSFDELASHSEIKPHLKTLMESKFEVHVLETDYSTYPKKKTVSEIQGPFPVFEVNDSGHIQGTEVYLYDRNDILTRIVPIDANAKQAWEKLCDLVNSDRLPPSLSIQLEKGDIIIFQEKSGLHDRDAYLVPEDQYERRWLKRASSSEGGMQSYSQQELAELEGILPDIIKKERSNQGLADPFYAELLQKNGIAR